jgi:hypothetical protein
MGYMTGQGAKSRPNIDIGHREVPALTERRVGRKQECPGGEAMQKGDKNGGSVRDKENTTGCTTQAL